MSLRTWLMLCLTTAMTGCGKQDDPQSLLLATTTSVQDTGLLELLLPMFREQTGIEVRPVAVGTGQALELARRGDADVLITHAPAAEEQFMREGWGTSRTVLMTNDFVIAGPADDPAGVAKESSAADAFAAIAREKAPFVSRGDDSGTHARERELWKGAGVEPAGEWYLSAGAGMAHSLRVAAEKRAYLLTDRGTFQVLEAEIGLKALLEGDPQLQNTYSVIIVNPARHPHVRSAAAEKFRDFLVSPQTKERIAQFGVEKYGRPLFVPAP